MTREEAVEILSDMRAEYNLFGNEEEATRYHVLSLAIKEMKAAQPEPCENTVSRKAVEEMLKNGFPARGMWEIEGDAVKQTICETLADALIDLERLPSAQPGWIPVSEGLPEVGRSVLMSVGKGLYTAEGELKHDGTWVQYRWSANLENVDAWAEMPNPWKGE